jgi:membrane AbrB-like protein
VRAARYAGPQASDEENLALLLRESASEGTLEPEQSALMARALRVPNQNFQGPMANAAALAATGHGQVPFPGLVLALAQVMLGTWLGSNFRRDRLASAGRLTIHFAVATVLVLGLCSGCAAIIAIVAGLNWETLVLGAAPGGVVEMALTAKFLGQDVALITAFHLTRIFMFMPAIPWIVGLLARYEQRRDMGQANEGTED